MSNTSLTELHVKLNLSPILISPYSSRSRILAVRKCGLDYIVGTTFILSNKMISSFSRISFSNILGQAIATSSMTSSTTRYAASAASVNISECSFNVNCGSSSGAVSLSSSVSSAVIKDCIFFSCYSTSGCAGLFSNAINVNVTSCCFDRCSAEYTSSSWNGGSGLSIESATSSIAQSISFIDSNYEASYFHGAMNVKSGSCAISFQNYTNNNGFKSDATSSGLCVYNSVIFSGNYIIFQSNIIISCVSISQDSGKIYSQCNFINNSSSGIGAVCIQSSSASFVDCNFVSSESCFFYEFSGGSFSAKGCNFSVSSESSLICSSSVAKSYSASNCNYGITASASFCYGETPFGSCVLICSNIPTSNFTSRDILQQSLIWMTTQLIIGISE